MSELMKILMKRDGLTQEQAKQQIKEAKKNIREMVNDPEFNLEEFMMEEFDLEPDYIFDLM